MYLYENSKVVLPESKFMRYDDEEDEDSDERPLMQL